MHAKLRVDHGGANGRPAGGYAVINELEYYAGSLLRDAHPKMRLVSAGSPKPLPAGLRSPNSGQMQRSASVSVFPDIVSAVSLGIAG